MDQRQQEQSGTGERSVRGSAISLCRQIEPLQGALALVGCRPADAVGVIRSGQAAQWHLTDPNGKLWDTSLGGRTFRLAFRGRCLRRVRECSAREEAARPSVDPRPCPPTATLCQMSQNDCYDSQGR